MKLLNNLKVGAKLGLGFGICLFLVCTIGLIGIRGMSSMSDVSRRITSDALQGLHDLSAIDSSLLKARSDYFEAYYRSKPEVRHKFELAADKEVAGIKAGMDSYGTSITSPEDSKNFEKLKGFVSAIVADISTLKGFAPSADGKEAKALFNGKMAAEFDGATDLADQMFEWNNTHGQNLTKDSERTYQSARSTVTVLAIISVLCGICVCIYVTRFIVRHVKAVSATMQSLGDRCVTGLANAILAMESGDLTVEVVTGTSPLEVTTNEEFGKLSALINALLDKIQGAVSSFGKSQNSLSTLVLDLQVAARNVSDTASSLAGTSQQVEAAAEEIGESMREVSSATEQAARGATEVAKGTATQARAISSGSDQLKTLVEAVHSVAGDAGSAAQSVDEATEVATAGGAVVTQSVEGMQLILVSVQESSEVIQELGRSSEKIGTIVQTIEEIAGQTNLLALNAAIEAARAGEAGRGFAVVADEVRKLAERSGSATREIATLISDIQTTTLEAVRSMESGMSGVKTQAKLAEDTGEAFEKIQKAFDLVTTQVQRISAATENMTSASDQVSHAISDAAAVIEESSAAAEELSASSEEVSASIQTVASSTHQQVAAVRDLVTSSENLSELARSLQQSVSQFKPRVEEPSRLSERKLHLLSA